MIGIKVIINYCYCNVGFVCIVQVVLGVYYVGICFFFQVKVYIDYKVVIIKVLLVWK